MWAVVSPIMSDTQFIAFFPHMCMLQHLSLFFCHMWSFKMCSCVCIEYHKEGCHPHMPISMKQHSWSLYEYEQFFHTESRDWTMIYNILTLHWQWAPFIKELVNEFSPFLIRIFTGHAQKKQLWIALVLLSGSFFTYSSNHIENESILLPWI